MTSEATTTSTLLSGSSALDVVLREHEAIAALPNVVRSIRRFVEAPLLKRFRHAMRSLASGEEMDQIMATYNEDVRLDALEGERVQQPSAQTALVNEVILYATQHGSTRVVQWALVATAGHIASVKIAETAIRYKHLTILQLLYPSMKTWITPFQEEKLFKKAVRHARGGNTKILDWIIANRISESAMYSLHAAENAARRGDLDVLKRIHMTGGHLFIRYAFEAAALHGHRHVMDWIQEQGVGFSVMEVMRSAALRQDFKTLTWLYDKCSALNTFMFWGFDELVRCDEVEPDVIAWLVRHYPHQYSYEGVILGALCGDLEIAKGLVAHQYPTNNQVKSAMITAARRGNLAVLQWLSSSFYSYRVPSRALWRAVTHGHLDVVRWITKQPTSRNLLTHERLAQMHTLSSRQQERDMKISTGNRAELTRWLEAQQQALSE